MAPVSILEIPPAVIMVKQSRFEVEEIRDRKVDSGRAMYLVKWKNYPENQNTWEPRKHLKSCITLVQEFEARRRLQSKPDIVAKQLEELLEKTDDYWEARKETDRTESEKQNVQETPKEPQTDEKAEKPPKAVKSIKLKRQPVFRIQQLGDSLQVEAWFLVAPFRTGEVVACYRGASGEVLVEAANTDHSVTVMLLEEAANCRTKELVRYLAARTLRADV